MTATPDVIVPATTDTATRPPLNPFLSNRYHFGMLLGVDDLETDQGYHRGKHSLHNAWLHGDAVVWGLDVVVHDDTGQHELAVAPGLALDGAGRELFVSKEQCLDLVAWYAARPEELLVTDDDERIAFTAHVVVRARTCLERPVPAMSEPCSVDGTDTAYSRLLETTCLELRANAAPEPTAPPYPRLRQLFGLEPAIEPNVISALSEIAAASDPVATRLAWFRRLAAADVTERAPHGGATGGELFPEGDDAVVVLANVDVRFTHQGSRPVLIDTGVDATAVDITVRPSHVATRTIEELLCGPRASAPDPANEGPRIEADSATLTDQDFTFRATAALLESTVTADAFAVTALDAAGWVDVGFDAPTLSADGLTVSVHLASATALRPLRLVGRGRGPKPILGTDERPVAGLVGGPPATADDGHDFALMIRS